MSEHGTPETIEGCEQADRDERLHAAHRDEKRSAPPCRARYLLIKILASGDAEIGDVAAAIMVPSTVVAAYLAGSRAVPLECQALLAAFAIERTPRHARLGRRLRGQLEAMIAFAMRDASECPPRPPLHRW